MEVSGSLCSRQTDPPRIPTLTLLFLATAEIVFESNLERRTGKKQLFVSFASCWAARITGQDHDSAELRKRKELRAVAFCVQALEIGRFWAKARLSKISSYQARFRSRFFERRFQKACLSEDFTFRSEDQMYSASKRK